jgi:heme oxygenase|tara:strand:+ start:374 stop:964 length:591 start_codon:yes stop_codon:yes gene_type:complete
MEQEKKYRIKDLTWEYHKNAERQDFVRLLLSGNIDEKLYATYLYNQLICYGKLEEYCLESSLFHDTLNLPRAPHIFYDYRALWTDIGNPPVQTESTKAYVEHLETIRGENEKLYAHVYVRHLGDLSGGQMIMRKTPGPNRYYIFKHGEIKEYKRIVKERVESYLNLYEVNVLPEAIFCFESATKLFKEMYDLGKTD